jgi:hypothetical protein
MKTEDAIQLFQKISHKYYKIKSPKYRHATYEDIKTMHESLLEIKKYLHENKTYHDLVNGVSQTLSKLKKDKALRELSRDAIWSNYSERGMNKTIRVSPKRKYINKKFPIKWFVKEKYECALTNGYWDEKNFIVMETLGYALLMSIGGDCLPKDLEPIFDNLKSIETRESQLNGNAPAVTAKTINKTTFSIGIDDSFFRRATGLKMSSTQIFNLLLETSRAEFKLPFPVKVKDNQKKESLHKMNYFSRFFELGEEKVKIRKDGVVQLRKYRINFSTLLGELFVNNLKSMFNDRVDLQFYSLPVNARLFYRQFLLTNDYDWLPLNLETIVDRINLRDKNRTNLINTLTANILEPLKADKLISSYEIAQGLKGTKFIIRRNDTCRRM